MNADLKMIHQLNAQPPQKSRYVGHVYPNINWGDPVLNARWQALLQNAQKSWELCARIERDCRPIVGEHAVS